MIGAEVTIKIHERLLLSCSAFSDPENVQHIGWYRCSTDDCEHHWNKFRIAHVKNTKVTIADDPDFDVYTNGTLVIKMVQPMDDKKNVYLYSPEEPTRDDKVYHDPQYSQR